MNMNVPKSLMLHLETTEKLLEGIRETLTILKKDNWIPPEHSCASIRRRVVQARQELLQIMREIDKSNGFYNWTK